MTGKLDWENIILGFKRTTKDFLETVVENLSESFVVTALDGKIVYYNKGSETLFGYKTEEIVGQHVVTLGVRKPNVLAQMQRGNTFRGEVWLQRKSGERFPAYIICIPLRDQNDKPMAMVGAARDLTQEKEIKRLKEFNENVITSLNDGIQIIDKDGYIAFTNRRFEEIIGYGKEELIGKHYHSFIDGDAAKRFERDISGQCSEKGKKTFEVTYITNDKRKAPVLVSTSRLFTDGDYAGMINAITDLTEVKSLKEELYQSEKLTLLGTLAGEIAHEVNNPLSGLLLATQMMIDDVKMGQIDHKELKKELEGIEKDALRCRKFIEKILWFARTVPDEKSVLNINETIDDALMLIQRQAKLDNISIVKSFSTGAINVLGNANQLQQVMINIVNNARDALITSGGTIAIKTYGKIDKGKKCVSIEINDSGKGIPDAVMARLFDSFVTTKAKGTGLGLSISKRIIDEHGGTITAANLKDRGASFMITLPIAGRKRLNARADRE